MVTHLPFFFLPALVLDPRAILVDSVSKGAELAQIEDSRHVYSTLTVT